MNKIDWKNPISRGLRLFGSMHTGYPVDYVTNRPGTFQSATRPIEPVDGLMALRTEEFDASTASIYFPKGDDYITGVSELTVMVYSKNFNSTSNSNQQIFAHIGTGNDPFYIRLGSAGTFQFRIWTDTPDNFTNSGLNNVSDDIAIDKWLIWGGTWGNDSLTVRAEKKKDNTPNATTGALLAPDTDAENVPRVGAGIGGGTDSWKGWTAFAAIWTRELSDDEWNSMVDDPWQLLKLDRRIIGSIPATVVAGDQLQITLVTSTGTPLASLTGLSWAWFDQSTPDTASTPTAQGTGETTDGSGLLSIDITGTTLTAGQTGMLALMDSSGMIYAWYRVTL